MLGLVARKLGVPFASISCFAVSISVSLPASVAITQSPKSVISLCSQKAACLMVVVPAFVIDTFPAASFT